MKQGWERKKIKDICDKATSNIAQNKIVGIDGDFPVYGASGFVQNVNFYHRDSAYIGVVKDGAGVGRVNIYPAYSSLLGTLQYILPKEGYLMEYVAYALKGLNLASHASGATIPHIYFKNYGEIDIPVPPLPIQERIVEELDCISGIIEKKKEQLKELDALAQSIFYTMFGDPVENDKGWEVKKLGELSKFKLSYGSGASAIPYDGYVRYVRITDITDSGKLNDDKVSPSFLDEKYLLNDGDILFARSGATVGKTYLYDRRDGKAIYAGYLIRFIPDTAYLLPSYIFRYTKTGFYKAFIKNSAQTVAQPNINAQQYSSLDVLLPPLPLQQEFAKKIETIEKQKELIRKSIGEVETLLASRMQEYFE